MPVTSKLSTVYRAPPESRTRTSRSFVVYTGPAVLPLTVMTRVGEPGGHSAACALAAGISAGARRATSPDRRAVLRLIELQHREERLLGNLHTADLLHA